MAKTRTELPAGVAPDGAPVPAAGDDQPKPPPFGTAKKLTERDVAGELPRTCKALDRVPAGSRAKRYKCRVKNYPDHAEPVYVLAADAKSAREHAVKAVGLDAWFQAQKDSGVKEGDLAPPQVTATELAD